MTGIQEKSRKLAVVKQNQLQLDSKPVMTANLDNIHEIYNIFCQKKRMHAYFIKLFDCFVLSQMLNTKRWKSNFYSLSKKTYDIL